MLFDQLVQRDRCIYADLSAREGVDALAQQTWYHPPWPLLVRKLRLAGAPAAVLAPD